MIRRVARSAHGGFTVVEMLIAMAMMTAVMGAILTLLNSAHRTFEAQGEVADMQQRLRASLDMLTRNVRMAGGTGAPVRPYRVGEVRGDDAAGVYYRPDTISIFSTAISATASSALPVDASGSPSTPVVATRTYYLKADPGSDTFDLMQYDGRQTDLPVVDHVASLAFEYFGDARPPQLLAVGTPGDLVTLDPQTMTDGPWWEDASGPLTFDADLLRIRCVGVTIRVRSALGPRLVPDMQIQFRVALRNDLAIP
jgi:type II secretory pathway pseudopilin PulG